MRMTSLFVRPATVTLEQFHHFKNWFQRPPYDIICRLRFFKQNRTVLSRSTFKGHVHLKHRAPSCEVSLERYFTGLSNYTNVVNSLTVI
jgi:hypothetical protein